MKHKTTFLLLAICLAGTVYAAQTAGDIIKLRRQKSKSAGDIIGLRKAQAQPTVKYPDANPYIRIGAGPAFAGESSIDAGYAFTAAIGMDFVEVPARMELEYGLQHNELGDNSDVTQQTFMGNLCYDFNCTAKLKPYLFGGVGFAYVDKKNTDTVFAGQAGAGIGYFLNDSISVDLCYRYLEVQDAGIDGHNITLGIRYSF